MSPILSLSLDLLVISLLVAAIVYAAVLSRRLREVRESRGEMAEMVAQLNETTTRAETAVQLLRQASVENGDELQGVIQQARNLQSDLSMMVQQAEAMAQRLEDGSRQAAAGARSRLVAEGAAEPVAPPPARAEPAPRRADSGLPPRRADAAPPAQPSGGTGGAEPRSQAERDLLKAIENMR